jgi:heat shock protein HslJ
MKLRVLGIAVVLAGMGLMLMTDVTRAQIPAEIVGVEWQWRGTLLNDGTVIRPSDSSRYTLEFGFDENVTVQADCNRGFGPFTTATDAMSIGPIATTFIACPPGSLDSLYLRQLDQVSGFRVLGNDLILVLGADLGWMRFARAAAPPQVLSGTWQWEGTLMNDGTAIVPRLPSRYTLEFGPDGRAAIRADCNTGNGPFTIVGNQISLGPFALTRALCPPGSLDTRFVKHLESVVSYLIVDGDLILELPFDSGGMRFRRAPGQ